MAKIYIQKNDEVYLKVWSDEASVEAELKDFFSYDFPGAKFTPKFKAGLWDGVIYLYCTFRKNLYVGLLSYLEVFAEKEGHQILWTEKEEQTKQHPQKTIQEFVDLLNIHNKFGKIEVRDYQYDAIQYAINNDRCVLLSPTSSGKSLIIYSLIRWHIANGRKCILIVPNTTLCNQMYSDFTEYASESDFNVEENVQILYSGFTKVFSKNVMISTWQSIYKQPKSWFKQFDVVFSDEVHGAKSQSLTDIMCKLDQAKYRIGTTGTLQNEKIHRLVIEGLFGKVYSVTTTKQLMDKGSVTKLKISSVILNYTKEERKILKGASYQTELDYIVDHNKRNRFLAKLALSCTGNTMILFRFVEKHAKPIYDLIKAKAGDRKVYLIYKDTSPEETERIRKQIENEKDSIIVTTYAKSSTGINIPSLENIIFGSPMKSKITNLQSVGRGLRLKDGKEYCNLFDIADNLSSDSKHNITFFHAMERYKIYKQEQFKVKMIEVNL